MSPEDAAKLAEEMGLEPPVIKVEAVDAGLASPRSDK
jgi:hypothetical protein